jgi:purine catabolism regulator
MFDNVSMLTVAELAAAPDLGLELVAGHAGADREIEAAAVSELANPARGCRGSAATALRVHRHSS